jgi:hypothetical protein
MGKDNVQGMPHPTVRDIDQTRARHLVADLVHTLARALASPADQDDEQWEWLATLAALVAVRTATDTLTDEAAAAAAAHGATYPALGTAAGTTRQNARVRWPGLVSSGRRRVGEEES